ncbi:MAG: histidine kinase [Elusimicrobia bacterium CG_4_10_14_0_8_um_filter_37_32]|nr:MAG: histidine kinase [Elusimicrobia bacterium CG_4_10_14_0_8_um_filter_37_32]
MPHRTVHKKIQNKKNKTNLNNLKTLLKEKELEINTLKRTTKTLYQISRTIVSGKYLEEILNLIVNVTAEMMGSRICSIMLLDEIKQELMIKSTQSLSDEYRTKPNIKVGQSISGKAVQDKKPIVVTDVTKEPGYMYPQIARKEGLCLLLSVPMIVKERVIGVINSYTLKEHQFSEEEIAVLESIANQAAVAIENAKLMEETLASREALEARKLIERAKGILMKKYRMTEEEAYKSIHRKSMDSRKPMKEVAEAIILTLDTK